MATASLDYAKLRFSTAGTKQVTVRVTAKGVPVEKTVQVVIKPNPVITAYQQGYGWYLGAVTGGAAGAIVHAYNYDQLKTYLTSATAYTVICHGVISGTSATINAGYNCQSNKTIIGAPGATFKGFGLTWSGKTNILIRNITCREMPDFEAAGKSKRDFFTFVAGTTRFCVNHCTMIGNLGTDSLLDITDGSDFGTISDCIYQSDDKGSLVGARDTEPLDTGKLRMSFFRNRWIDIFERSPSYRLGAGCDVMNNLYESVADTSTVGYAIGSRCGATVRARSNDFSAYKGHALQCIDGLANTSPGVPIPFGVFSDKDTNIFGSGTNVLKGTAPSSWQPPYESASFEIPVADVKATVKLNAGANLTLAQMGY